MTITVDGKPVATAAAAKTIVGPLTLSAGSHTITAEDPMGTAIVTSSVSLVAGANIDTVLHRQVDPSQPGSTVKIGGHCGSEHANTPLSRRIRLATVVFSSRQKGIHAMRVSHRLPAISATFDDPNLVRCGLGPDNGAGAAGRPW